MNIDYRQLTSHLHNDVIRTGCGNFRLDGEDDIESILKIALNGAGVIEPHAMDMELLRANVLEHPEYSEHTTKWYALFNELRAIFRSENPNNSSSEETSEELEEPAPEDDAPDEEDEDGENLNALKECIQKDFTYIPQVKNLVVNIVQKHQVINVQINFVVHVLDAVKGSLKYLKDKAREVSDFLGVNGVLIVLAKAMKHSILVDVIVKCIGTALCLFLIALAAVIAALRWTKNPVEKFLSWAANLLGIKPPDPED